MTGNRRVNVFYRSDGRCIYDKSWDDDGSNHVTDGSDKVYLSGTELWPLLQVFVQFSREVQGGPVKRLVFRNPKEYAPTVKRFESMPQQSETVGKRPFVVHVAHDEVFAVTVCEVLRAEGGSGGVEGEGEENQNGISIASFCEMILDHLSKEQTAFLATISPKDLSPRPDTALPNSYRAENYEDSETTDVLDGASTQEHTTRASVSSSEWGGSLHPTLGNEVVEGEAQLSCGGNPIVTINEPKLCEFIDKTQQDNLSRML